MGWLLKGVLYKTHPKPAPRCRGLCPLPLGAGFGRILYRVPFKSPPETGPGSQIDTPGCLGCQSWLGCLELPGLPELLGLPGLPGPPGPLVVAQAAQATQVARGSALEMVGGQKGIWGGDFRFCRSLYFRFIEGRVAAKKDGSEDSNLCQKGLRYRISPVCTLSQNGYGDIKW